jgi:hypothetical protein
VAGRDSPPAPVAAADLYWDVELAKLGLNTDAKQYSWHHLTEVLLPPLCSFAPALNAALSFAAARGFSHILYQSLEVAIGAHTLKLMKAAFDPDWDLVVGAGGCVGRGGRPIGTGTWLREACASDCEP